MLVTFSHVGDLERILHDAATPRHDRLDVIDLLSLLSRAGQLLELMLGPVPEVAGGLLQEYRTMATEQQYGMVFERRETGYQALAYYRDPPLFRDSSMRRHHGFSRAHAIELARKRRDET